MSGRQVNGIDDMRALAGQELGTSDWLEVTQEHVNEFASATGDHQWIHVDPERAKDGPFGGTIAHGYFTVSLAPVLLRQIIEVQGVAMALNYGIDKLRFPSPVPVGSRVRMTARMANLDEVTGGVQATIAVVIEVEGQTKPAVVADVVYRYFG